MERTAAPPTDRAAHIVKLHQELIVAAKSSVRKAIEIGRLLTEQKASMNHGAWLPWIHERLPFSQPTAFNYMQCYEHRDKLFQVNKLSEAYKLLASRKEKERTEKEVVSTIVAKFITG
jgi:hypothetical protein